MQPTRTASYPAAVLLQGTYVLAVFSEDGQAQAALPGGAQPSLTETTPVPTTTTTRQTTTAK